MVEKILITGATGLLGQHIVRQAIESNKNVRVLVRDKKKALFPYKIEMIEGDIRDFDTVYSAIHGCDYVIHSCSTHIYNLPYNVFYGINVTGTRNVCDAIEKQGCSKLVLTSAISTLKSSPELPKNIRKLPPRKLMSATKRIAENEVLCRINKGVPAVIINPAYFIGPYDYNPSPFRLWCPLGAKRKIRFVPSGGFNVLSVVDVARIHMWAIENGEIGKRYPIGGCNITLVDYASIINQVAGHPHTPMVMPTNFLKSIAYGKVFDQYTAGLLSKNNFVDSKDIIPESLILHRDIATFESKTRVCDTDSSIDELQKCAGHDVALSKLYKTIEETVDWFLDNSDLVNLIPLLKYMKKRYI